eukprot:1277201-Amorphochlora_amoeboformis.AAC.1
MHDSLHVDNTADRLCLIERSLADVKKVVMASNEYHKREFRLLKDTVRPNNIVPNSNAKLLSIC